MGEKLFTASAGEIKAEFMADDPFKDTSPNTAAGVSDSKSDVPPKATTFLDDDDPIKPELSSKRATALETQLQGMYATAAMMIWAFDPQVANTILEQSGDCAKSLNDLAKKNPKVRKALDSMLTTSAYGAVIGAHLPIAVLVATKYVPYVREQFTKTANTAATQEPEHGPNPQFQEYPAA